MSDGETSIYMRKWIGFTCKRASDDKTTIALGPLENNNKKKNAKWRFFYFARHARKLSYYGDVIYSFFGYPPQNTIVVFQMRDSVPSARYPPFLMYCVMENLAHPYL